MSKREYMKLWRKANRTRLRAYALAYKRANPESYTLSNARQRCYDQTNWEYHRYGGRGIEVRYKSAKELIADIGRRPGPGWSIDRINNDGHYEPGNCRWSTAKDQAMNRHKRGYYQ